MWHVKLFTLFPEIFPGPLGYSLSGQALEKGIWSYETINIRDFSCDKRKSVDDTPTGGGPGMVMRPDVLGKAIEYHCHDNEKIIYMSPRGRVLKQKDMEDITAHNKIAIICGRFEGIDERVIEAYNIKEFSIGDYVLSGGELAAFILMDACIRILPGVIGNEETLNEESFGKSANYTGLLEYPLYTKPTEWKGRSIPEVLLSGNHQLINEWRLNKAKEITKTRRPDLWKQYN